MTHGPLTPPERRHLASRLGAETLQQEPADDRSLVLVGFALCALSGAVVGFLVGVVV